jgi:aminopeptidase
MTDPRVTNLAKILVEYSTRVKAGDRVAIIGSPLAAPLIVEVFRQSLRAGAYPHPFMGLELLRGMDALVEVFFQEANEDQLTHIMFTDDKIIREFDVMISIRAQENTRGLSNVDPARQALRKKARAELTRIYLERGAKGELRWCGTLYPTAAHAQDAEMSLEEFEDYVFGATFADSADPVAEWRRVHDEQERLVNWLKGKKDVVVRGPNVDLQLSIEGRTFINSDGTHNMPSGEIFTGPVEDSAEGWVRFTYPAVLEGREVSGVELRFEAGKVVEAKAEKNAEYLHQMLEVDPGARFLGEFAIGTNHRINRFIKNILYDEKIGGTIHMALGAGYPQTGSKNQSAIHWDMICDMRPDGEIYVDGELFYRGGEFVV